MARSKTIQISVAIYTTPRANDTERTVTVIVSAARRRGHCLGRALETTAVGNLPVHQEGISIGRCNSTAILTARALDKLIRRGKEREREQRLGLGMVCVKWVRDGN